MLRASVKRNQFDVSQDGIVHKPTNATFVPDPADVTSGTIRVGRLSSQQPNDGGFKPDDVCRLMNELWAEYIASHPDGFPVKS